MREIRTRTERKLPSAEIKKTATREWFENLEKDMEIPTPKIIKQKQDIKQYLENLERNV